MEPVIGINIFAPRDDVMLQRHTTNKSLKAELQLNFIEQDGLVSAYVNIEKTLTWTWLLQKEGINQALQFHNNCLLVYAYTDAFPWMVWSRHFSGETAVRLKLVEPHNFLSTIVTVCQWLGPDKYSHVSNLGYNTFMQLNTIDEITHPITNQKIKVIVRGLADEASRSTTTGVSSQAATYPITEAPEHKSQLGDMTLACEEPIRTTETTKEMKNKYKEWLGGEKDNKQNRREFATENFGYTGNRNTTGIEFVDFYPGTMHKCMRATETIVRRIGVVAQHYGLKKEGFTEIKKVARKVSTDKWDIKFDEHGLLAFYSEDPNLLKTAGFKGLCLDILTTFCRSLHDLFTVILYTPEDVTREVYDVQACILLGFNFVFIFGTHTVTATIKHLVSYMGYYIDKAQKRCFASWDASDPEKFQ